MRRFPAWLAAAVLLAATACGDEAPKAAPTVTVPPKPLKQATPAQLKAALPTLADLPQGWQAGQAGQAGNESDSLIHGCPDLGEPAWEKLPSAEAEFVHPSAQLFMLWAYSGKSVAEAGTVVDSLRAMLQECPSFRLKEPSGTVTRFSLSVVSPPKLADEAFALLADVVDPQFRGTIKLVAFRIRNHTVLVGAGRVGKAADGGAEMDPKLFEQLARLAVTKAERVLPKA